MRDFVKAFVIGVVVGAVFYGLTVCRSLIAENAAQAAVELVVPPDYEKLEIETPAPAAPVEVTVPAAEEPVVDYAKQARQRMVLAYSAGLLCEAMSNATSGYTPGAAFSKSFLKQFGVQLQVAVLTDADLISRDPALAFAQGFMIGL
ncbi:hypothetical protein [Sphingorhabdus sp.]|uniref:hypothetical protein n=1 Tax=Sphingorhabdus sp. TaxID=1902408 RepID=UPI00333E80E7